MKKITAAMLALALCLALAACANPAAHIGEADTPEPLQAEIETGTDKIQLTLATTNLSSDLQNLVDNFNQTNDEYEIIIFDFTEDFRDGDTSIASQNSEILGEKAPDIYAFDISTEFMNTDSTERSSLYENLLPYLDADPEYDRDTLLPGIMNALTQDGKLYTLPYDFSITTFSAPRSIVGDVESLTMEKALAFAAEIGEDTLVFPEWLVKREMFIYVLSYVTNMYVDPHAGVSDFNNPDFIELLEACNRQHDKPPTRSFPHGDELLSLQWFFGVDSFRHFLSNIDGDYTYVGIPSNLGTSGIFRCNIQLQMSSQSEHKDAVWSFLRTALRTKNIGTLQNFHTTQEGLRTQLKELIHPDYQEDIDKLTELINRTEIVESSVDYALREIILDQADIFFAGECTAEEAAERIQNAATNYLNNHK